MCVLSFSEKVKFVYLNFSINFELLSFNIFFQQTRNFTFFDNNGFIRKLKKTALPRARKKFEGVQRSEVHLLGLKAQDKAKMPLDMVVRIDMHFCTRIAK